MGAVDVSHQALNVTRTELLGARVVEVRSGSQTLKDAMNEAIRNWIATSTTTHYREQATGRAARGARLRCGTTVPSLGECVVSRTEHLVDKEGDDRYDEAQRAEGVLARVRQEVGEAPAERVRVHERAERDVDPSSEAIDREGLACDEGGLPFHVDGQRRRRLLSPLSTGRSAVPGAGILSIDETASQAGVELFPKRSTALDEQRLVDRLVGHPHRRIIRIAKSQPRGDLLG